MKYRILLILLAGILALPGGVIAQSRVVDMDFREADVLDVFRVLGEMGGLNVIADRSVEGKVTFFLKSMPVREAIDLVARTSGYRYKVMGNTLVIASAERLAQEFTQEELAVIQLRHLSVGAAKEIAALVLEDGKVVADERTGSLIIRGTGEQIDKVKALLQKFDVPLPLEFDFVETPIKDILRSLAKAGGYNIIIDPAIEGNLTMYLKDMAVSEAIDAVSRAAGLDYNLNSEGVMIVKVPGVLTVAAGDEVPQSGREAEPETVFSEVMEIKYLSPETARKLLLAVLPTLQVEADADTGIILVRGTRAELEQAKELIRQKDIPEIRVTGIVQRGEEHLAVLEINGRSEIVRENDRLADFLIERIADREVIISRGNYRTTLPLGKMGE